MAHFIIQLQVGIFFINVKCELLNLYILFDLMVIITSTNTFVQFILMYVLWSYCFCSSRGLVFLKLAFSIISYRTLYMYKQFFDEFTSIFFFYLFCYIIIHNDYIRAKCCFYFSHIVICIYFIGFTDHEFQSRLFVSY